MAGARDHAHPKQRQASKRLTNRHPPGDIKPLSDDFLVNALARRLNGFIPGLKDWVDAKCDKWTAVDKAFYEAIRNKPGNQMTKAERIMSDAITKKNEGRDSCEREIRSELSLRVHFSALEKRGGN
jgi:hypothetical protein